jgi:hypothetical protein
MKHDFIAPATLSATAILLALAGGVQASPLQDQPFQAVQIAGLDAAQPVSASARRDDDDDDECRPRRRHCDDDDDGDDDDDDRDD